MDAMYVLIECTGFRQLSRIDPVLAKSIVKEISAILVSQEPLIEEGDRFLYQLSPDMQPKAVASGLMQLFAMLLSRTDDLFGFTIIADSVKDGTPIRAAYKRIVRLLFSVEKDESMWVTKSAFLLLNAYLECLPGEELHEIVSRVSAAPTLNIPLDNCLRRQDMKEAVIEELLSLHQGDAEGYLLITGPDFSGKLFNTVEALKTIAGRNSGASWLVLRDFSAATSPYDPFLNAVDEAFLPVLNPYLSHEELRLWESKRKILEDLSEIALVEDFYLAFKLYVHAYIREKEEELLPPVMLCIGIDTFSETTLHMLEKLFHEFLVNTPLLPVCICRSVPEHEDLLAMPHRTIEFIPEAFSALEKKIGPFDADLGTEEGFERIDGLNIPMFHYLMLHRKGKVRFVVKGPLQLAEEILKTLESETRIILYGITLSDGLLTRDQLQAFFITLGLDVRTVNQSFTELAECGLVWPGMRPVCSLPELSSSLEREKDAGILFTKFAAYIHGIWKSEHNLRASHLLRFLGRYYHGESFLEMYHDLVMHRLEESFSAEIMSIIQKGEEQLKEVKDTQIREKFSLIFHTCRMKYALITEDRDRAQDEYLFVASNEDCEDVYDAERFLELSRYHAGFGDFRSALAETKKAIICIQQNSIEGLEGIANIELGKIMLGMRKIDEAREYFSIAREVSRNPNFIRQDITASMYEALTDFLFGNLSSALEHTEDARLRADRNQERDIELFLIFLAGRIQYSLGAYTDAACQFEQCLTICELYSFEEREKVFRAWLGRSFAYGGYPEKGIDILRNLKQDSEVLYFLSEASYLCGQYKRALHYIHEALNTEREMIHVSLKSDNIEWDTGFSSVEDRALKTPDGQGILFHLIKAFRGFLLGLNGNTEEGFNEISRLYHEEKLSDIDPYNSLYYLYNTLILPEREGETELDRLTLLSKSLRFLQQFASRIREPHHKQAFMRDNYWNRILLNEARKDKLV